MLTFAVLGCGRIGRMHAANLAAHPQARLRAVYDVASDAADRLAAELGVKACGDIGEILDDPGIDAVLIASSTPTHVPLIEAAARAGKAILCEKPIDLDMARAQACWATIAPFQPVVAIGFNRRFDPSFKALRERLRGGEIGALEQLTITSRDPAPPPASYVAASGGLFRDMTIHDFDMARYLAGEIVEVHALGANLIEPAIGQAGDIDAAMIVMRARSGALVHINNSRRCSYGYDQRIEAFGAMGMLKAGNQRATTVELWRAESTAARDPVQDFFIERYQDAYAAEIDDFVAAVREGRAPLAGFADGIEALRLADAALESLKSGRSVRLDPPAWA